MPALHLAEQKSAAFLEQFLATVFGPTNRYDVSVAVGGTAAARH